MALQRRKPTNQPQSEASEYDWKNLEAGEFEGRLVMVADLGLQHKEFKGEDKGNIQQLSLGIEIIDAGMVDDNGVMMPRVLWTNPFYIYSKMGGKSMEYKYYKVFDPKAKEDTIPDWEAQLGKPCNVIVENVEGKEGRVYDNVLDVTSIPAKFHSAIGEAISETGIGDSDDPENIVNKSLRGLSKFVFDKRVVEGKEEVAEEGPAAESKPAAKPKPAAKAAKKVAKSPTTEQIGDEDIPY